MNIQEWLLFPETLFKKYENNILGWNTNSCKNYVMLGEQAKYERAVGTRHSAKTLV